MFVQYTAEVSGSPISGLTVVDAVQDIGMSVDLILGVGGPLEAEYAAHGCRIHHLRHGQWLTGGSRFRRARRWTREARATWHFIQLIKRIKPRVVYVNTLVSIAAVLAARIQGVPVIWHIREMFRESGGEMYPPLGGRALVRAAVRLLPSKVVCVSKSVQMDVIGPNPCAKAEVIYNPLAESFFEYPWSRADARACLGLPAPAFVVGLPGTLRPVKGHEFFLDTAAYLVQRSNRFHFAITGDVIDDYARSVVDRCRAMGLEQQVSFVGPLTDMRLFYAACDVACVPSRGEPFGRTVIEGFAQRCPVVATRVGGMPEAIKDGENGLLVEYGDVEALARCLTDLRDQTDLRRRLAESAWEAAAVRYREKVYKRKISQVISEI